MTILKTAARETNSNSLQNLKYSAKKLCLFNYNLSLRFRNKTIKMTGKTPVTGFTLGYARRSIV